MAQKCFDCGEYGDDLVSMTRTMTYKKTHKKSGAKGQECEISETITVNVHPDCVDYQIYVDDDDLDVDDQ